MELEALDVIEKVRTRLSGTHPGGATLQVLDEEVRRSGQEWRVPVLPSVEPTKRSEYLEALVDVEMVLHEEDGINVFFEPVPQLNGVAPH